MRRKLSPPPRALWLTLLLLALSIALFQFTPIDVWLQDRFYDRETGRWIVDRNEPIGRALFYHGPKVGVWAVALGSIALALGPARWRRRWHLDRRGLFLAVLSIATVPALASLGKQLTRVHCPYDLRRYGGREPYVELCSCHAPDDPPTRRGGCYPAAHASGGFALLGLVALRDTRRWKVSARAVGLGAGWWMGAYQMLKGAHFLSHTITTMLLAWIVVDLWRWTLGVPRAGAAAPDA